MKIELYLYNKLGVIDISTFITGSIVVTTTRQASASTLEFKFARDLVVQNNLNISFEEGNMIYLLVNDNKIFKGFIFSKSRDKEQIISVKCYDQLRYLSNKQSYTYVNKKASDIIKMIARDFNLNIGKILDTGFVIGARDEDNQTLLDIILTSLELTFLATNKLYIFYDDFGNLTLKELSEMNTNIILADNKDILNFNYKTDIDGATYNKIKLYKDNEKTGSREVYIAQDSDNIAKWGLLQYYEKLDDNYNTAQAEELAKNILKAKNKINETLSINVNNFEINTSELEKLRAGNFLYVIIDYLGEKNIRQSCLIEKCSHSFSNEEHTINMDLTLS